MNYSMEELELAYRNGNPLISNAEWDELVRKTKYNEKIGDTPIIEKSLNGRDLVPMKTPLISLNKIYNKLGFDKWFGNLSDDKEIYIEPKLDGNACNVQYVVNEDGTATRVRIGSSGDGEKSLIPFDHALDYVSLRGIPDILPKESVDIFRINDAIIDNMIEIRGEIIINKDMWYQLNEVFGKDYYKTWCQMVAAIMNRQRGNSYTSFKRRLPDINVYEYSFPLKKDKTNENWVKFNEVGLISALIKYGFKETDSIEFEAYDIYVISGDKWVNLEDLLPELTQYGSKITSIKETVDLVTYSCSTKEGNKDCDFLYTIPELITFKTITFDELETILDKDMVSTRILTSKKEIDKIINYVGNFFGNSDWNPDASEIIKDNGKYGCDGLVFKIRGEADKGVYRTGVLAHHPTNFIAIKLMPKGIETEILNIWEETTELGNVTIHATINPIVYHGAEIKNINLFNPQWYEKRKDKIFIGAKVRVVMSAGLIPVLYDMNNQKI